MNVGQAAHLSGQMSGQTVQINQVPGTGVGVGGADGLPQHQPMQEMAAFSGTDQQFVMLRHAMREKIFEYIGRKQSSAEWRKRLPELAKRLEEILYRKFPNKNEYYNMMKGPVEPQLQFAIKTLSAQNQHNQQNPQMTRQIASSSGYGTMIPTPDSEDFQPVAPVVKVEPLKNQWADEDVEEDDVKESWEEEEEEEKPMPAPVEKAAAKPSTKAPAKKGKQQASTSAEEPDEPPLSPTSEKRLVEEADFKSTTELFAKKGGEQKSLDTFIPKSESDFAEYAELIANKLRPYEKSFHYMALLKNVMRLSMTSLKGADAKEISSSVTAIANEKIKAEKEAAAGKKKQGAKKKQLHIEKGDDDFIPGRGGGYDDPDEYDFM